MGIYSELSRIQTELKAPKNLYNKFGDFKYRNAEGILESVKPLLNGLVILLSDDIVLIGTRFYIKATATLSDGKESVSSVAFAREDEFKKGMDGCQLTGSCSSYARKYALNGLLAIDDNKDADDDSQHPNNPKNNPPETPDKNRNNTPDKKTGTRSGNLPHGKKDPPANVDQSKQLPPEAVDAGKSAPPPEPPKNPVTVYLLKEMKNLREERGISASANNKIFDAQFKKLVEKGLTPDKKLESYTLEEAKNLISMMYEKFTPEGTELKEE